jgi:hypothetical protein
MPIRQPSPRICQSAHDRPSIAGVATERTAVRHIFLVGVVLHIERGFVTILLGMQSGVEFADRTGRSDIAVQQRGTSVMLAETVLL